MEFLNSEYLMLFQMPVTFEDVALYLSREEWGRLDHTQQNFYRDMLQKRTGLALGKGSPVVGPSASWGVREGAVLLAHPSTLSFSLSLFLFI
jgi:hypothetical protein